MNHSLLTQESLLALCSDAQKIECQCPLVSHLGWQSIGEHRWPKDDLTKEGSLRDLDLAEPTFEEWHPLGTRYESPEAPVAIAYFPYNRADVFSCKRCNQVVLRYTEAGGYYVDQRARRIDGTMLLQKI
jgi:hypothetical protein